MVLPFSVSINPVDVDLLHDAAAVAKRENAIFFFVGLDLIPMQVPKSVFTLRCVEPA